MDHKNGLVDVSRFFLFEHSGDSELDSESPMDITMATAVIGGDEDDAESCSCDMIGTERHDDFYGAILRLLDDDGDEDLIGCNDEDRVEEEPDSGIDLCGEAMDRMEDRLFWETCMAVGYPWV
ncbi:hypothetical protein F3Y22_tig00111504pilonHSYRG00039 [Hibiscus syriacus]|uniref:Uncharacterized protein n=1 Tax=Hibiscus syriacus TaxID=106335 RepID=A0A6A2YES8_HIBSY|nr:hypothetical protein F3Y22_tig00111504pilonHSYRG00039 [Hibiscus syriacus]